MILGSPCHWAGLPIQVEIQWSMEGFLQELEHIDVNLP